MKKLSDKIIHFLAHILGCNPKFVKWVIIISAILFASQLFIGYQYQEIMTNLKMKPDVEIEISPFLQQAAFGEYLPLIITNTGDFTFENVDIFVSTCQMLDDNYFEYYNLPLLPARSERTIPFGNKDTVNDFKRANCYPFAGKERPYPNVSINPRFVDNFTVISTGCGICYFNATIRAIYYKDNKNESFKKDFRSYFPNPVDLEITVSRNL